METEQYISYRGIILDVIVFLGIVITAIYTNKRRRKDNGGKGQNDIKDKNGTNDEKGVIIKEVQQNVKKYKDGKQLFIAIFSIPTLIIMAIALPICIGFSLYDLITKKADDDILISLIIYFVILIFYIFLFKNSKKVIDGYTKGLFYGIIGVFFKMFIVIIIVIVLWGCISLISHVCQKLNLNPRLGFVITILFVYFSIELGRYFLAKYNRFNSKDSSKNNGDSKYIDSSSMNSKISDNEEADNEVTYDELVDNNKKMKEKTGFHQGSLLKK